MLTPLRFSWRFGGWSNPGVELRATLKSISHRCHLFEEAVVCELTNATVHLPLGCLQSGLRGLGFGEDRRAGVGKCRRRINVEMGEAESLTKKVSPKRVDPAEAFLVLFCCEACSDALCTRVSCSSESAPP